MTALGFIETKGLVAAIESADAMLKAADVCLLEKNQVGAGLVTITVTGEVSAVKASVDAATAAVQRIAGAELVSTHVIARPDTELEHIILTKVPSDEDVSTEEPGNSSGPENDLKDHETEIRVSLEESVPQEDESEKDSGVPAEEKPAETKDPVQSEEVSAEGPENIDETKTEESESLKDSTEKKPIPEMPEKDSKAEEEIFESKPKKATPVSKKALKAASKTESPRFEISQLKKMNVSKLRLIARSFDSFSIARKEIKFARKKELIEAIMNAYRQEKEE